MGYGVGLGGVKPLGRLDFVRRQSVASAVLPSVVQRDLSRNSTLHVLTRQPGEQLLPDLDSRFRVFLLLYSPPRACPAGAGGAGPSATPNS